MRTRSQLIAFIGGLPLLAIIGSLVLAGCQRGNGSHNTVPERDIKTVMEAHVEELMALSGVVGVAIGELDGGTPCIKVLVVEQTDELSRQIPKVLEGHPVEIMVTGEIRPLSGDQ